MTIAKEILLDELNEQTHPINVEDVIFWALEAYETNNNTNNSIGKLIAYSIKERILEAERSVVLSMESAGEEPY